MSVRMCGKNDKKKMFILMSPIAGFFTWTSITPGMSRFSLKLIQRLGTATE
jgi:hypothetical protein